MRHEQCITCNRCAWVAYFDGKWQCECIRPRFWGFEDEDGVDCDSYQETSYEIDE